MTPLRVVAIVVFAVGMATFATRGFMRAAGERKRPLSAPAAFAGEHRRLLEHRADSILGIDGRTRQSVAYGFPSTRPVVAFLYQSTCQACLVAKLTWERTAHLVGDRAHMIAATLDAPRAANPFLEVPLVADLHLDLPSFRRAFAVSEVVPITVLIERNGQVSWARIGPLDAASTALLLDALPP